MEGERIVLSMKVFRVIEVSRMALYGKICVDKILKCSKRTVYRKMRRN